jgi:hypothetical protein
MSVTGGRSFVCSRVLPKCRDNGKNKNERKIKTEQKNYTRPFILLGDGWWLSCAQAMYLIATKIFFFFFWQYSNATLHTPIYPTTTLNSRCEEGRLSLSAWFWKLSMFLYSTINSLLGGFESIQMVVLYTDILHNKLSVDFDWRNWRTTLQL